ncbi:MAG: hypothetical protein MOB07_19835 [Acidobacteria bacterium]|nr:hypothetical protein [Acidobacteriota bacterium]
MKEYKDYQSKLSDVEKQENEGSDATEQHVPAAFLLLFAFISAGATYYLNEAGMRESPFYSQTIGAERAAYLVTGILEGSFLALTLLGHKILKSKSQRSSGKLGCLILKAVLSVNILVTFVLLATGRQSRLMPLVQFYAQWGAPLTVIGAGWLWAHIVTHRRKTIMRNQMLDDAAETERLWAEQHRTDQKRYRDTYQNISDSPEFQELREEIAVTQAIEQIARESQITFQEAEEIYYRIQGRKQRQLGTPGYQSSNWRSQGRP